MSYQGDTDSRSYGGLGPAGYQEPFPGGKPPSPYDPYYNGPSNHGRPDRPVRLEMTPEELKLASQITQNHSFTRVIPLGVGAFLGTNFLIRKGIIKTSRPGLYYFGATLASFIFSKYTTVKEVQKQLLERYPDGVYAQTRNMTPSQMMEYMKQRNLQTAREKVEASGMTVQERQDQTTEKPKFNPDVRNQSAGLDDRYRPTVDSFEFQRKQEDQSNQDPVSKKTYAQLRQQAHRDIAYANLPSSLPEKSDFPQREDRSTSPSEDPPSKMRVKRKNKYGDDME